MKRLWAAAIFTAMLSLGAIAPSLAAASFGLSTFDGVFTDSSGVSTAAAGSHPYAFKTSLEVNTLETPEGPVPDQLLKDVKVIAPRGFIGDQTAVPVCSTLDFLTTINNTNATHCADSSAVGVAKVTVGEGDVIIHDSAPIYNLTPSPGTVAKLGFMVKTIPVTVDVGISETPPYKIVATTANATQVLEFIAAEVTLWGVPANPAHDKERGACYEGFKSCSAGVPERPFLTLPRACEGPLEIGWEADSWQQPGEWVKGFSLTHDSAIPPEPQGMVGCGKLAFDPSTQARPSTSSAESASGLDFEIDVSDEGLKNPEEGAIAKADIAAAQITFPVGVTANPSAAEGLGVCTMAQFEAEALSTPAGAGCPEAAKLGTIEAETPLLAEHPLRGSLFLAAQDDPATPGQENPFNSLLALYMIIRDPGLGVFVKLPVKVEPDPKTGQLIATSEGLPPFPLSHVDIHMRSGPRAPLVTPPTCGTYTTTALLTPSSGAPPLKTASTFTINSGPGGGPCPAGGTPPLHPGFEAGSVNNAAGAFSPFNMRLTRADGEQDLTRFSATLPPGVVPKLAGIAKCQDAAIEAAKSKSGRQELASPSCPADSLIGHVTGGAGVGNALTYVNGTVYLAGPYNGDPLSAVAIVPAVAGPFDVGTVVTRVALTLNPVTYLGEIDGAASDPIPHILKGLPLKLRDLRVYADRPGFTMNPTSCEKTQTTATIFGGGADVFSSADDVAVQASSRYQAASCASLLFAPKLSINLKGGTRRNDHPALHALLTYPPGPGYANTGKAVVTLPHSEFIDPNHLNNPCTRAQFAADACPPTSVLGSARAITPLLDEPLEGPVYFRSNGGERKVPDVVADLHGLIDVILIGKVDSVNARIRTTFDEVPDAPVTKFTLDLYGGKKGLLVNSANLCSHKRHVKIALTGKNGRRHDSEPVLKTSCKAKGKSSTAHRRPRAH